MQPDGTTKVETAPGTPSEPQATPQATGTEQVPAKEQAPEVVDYRAQLETERKERQKAEMRARQLENEREKTREAELKEREEYKTLYEEAQNKLEEQKQREDADQARKDAEDLRKRILEEYPDERTRKAAEQLIAANPSNLVWGEVTTEEDAKADLFKQLDAIKAIVSPDGEQAPQVPGARIDANNPAPLGGASTDRAAMVEEAGKKGDFTKIIQTLPSVQVQIARMKGE